MSYKAYNDYELIYMVQDQQDMMALDILFTKYDKFIHKKISQFYIFDSDRDDFYQEGLISLHKAILSFKDTFNKTFMRYFETVLERKFINLNQKRKRYHQEMDHLLSEAKYMPICVEEDACENYQKQAFKSALEEAIYDAYFRQNQKIPSIARTYQLDPKQVYNAIYRIKKKLTQTP